MEKCGVCPDRETCEYSEVDDEEQQEEEEIDEEELKESAQPTPWTMPEIYAAATTANCSPCTGHCQTLHSFTSSLIHCPSSLSANH
jgi:hypothetical protein